MKRLLTIAGMAGAVLAPIAGLAALALGPGCVERWVNVVKPAANPVPTDTARRLHERLFVADLHSDLLLWARDPLERSSRGHTDVPRLIDGNVGLQVFSTVTKVPLGLNYERNTAKTDTITALAILQRWPLSTWSSLKSRSLYQARRLADAAERSQGRLFVIRSVADLDRYLSLKERNRHVVAGLLSTEGLHVLEGDLGHVNCLYAAGYRMFGLTHLFDNDVAGSAHGVAKGGLTPFGRRVVRRMEELGILIDLAHASPRAIDDVLQMATRPVVVSHTGVQATCPGPRNLSDDQVRGVAEVGGVIGIGYWDGAVCEMGAASTARAIRHVADLVGVDKVALGSDFDGGTRMPFDATGLVHITQALLDEGFVEHEVASIMGRNVLDLLRVTLPRS